MLTICSCFGEDESAHPYFLFQCAFSLFYAKIIPVNIINLYDNYNSYFNADLKAIFEHCSKIAFKSGHKLYLIGGIVRDLLLNKKNNDIDITVVGDAIEFVYILEKQAGAKVLSLHKNFGTAKVEINNKKIDFASTRSEIYPKKGHLPVVTNIGCSLEKDVTRRDFTINSLAISLNYDSFADLIDYVNGFEDLKAKKIRVLHDKSFIDDPTRIIRALKYSTRLGFDLEENTFKLQNEYLEKINYDMCNKRIKQEIKKTFEQNLQGAFDKFTDQKIYKLITKKEIEKPHANIENLIKKYSPKHPWLVYFGIIGINESEEFIDKLELTKAEKNVIEGAKSLINEIFKDDFELYKAFNGIKYKESLLILASLGKEKEVSHYLDDLSKIKLQINGDDLIKVGFKPSKKFSEGFDYALRKKLKNPKMSKTDELELIKEFLI